MHKIQDIFWLFFILAKNGEGEGEKERNAVSCNRELL